MVQCDFIWIDQSLNENVTVFIKPHYKDINEKETVLFPGEAWRIF